MKDVQFARLYHPDGSLQAITPVEDGHFAFLLKRDRYDKLVIRFGNERSYCHAEDFTSPYVVPDVDSIKVIIGKINEISGSLSSKDCNLLKSELEYNDYFRDPFDKEAYERSRLGEVELLSYMYLQHLDDRVGLDALVDLMSYNSLPVKDFVTLYETGSRRLRRLFRKRVSESIEERGGAYPDQEANDDYLKNGYNATEELIEKYSLAPSLENKQYVAFLSESAWLIATKEDSRCCTIFYGSFQCDTYLTRSFVPGDRYYIGIDSLFSVSIGDVTSGYQDGNVSPFSFYYLSVSQNHSDHFHFNSNIASVPNMSHIMPLEAMVAIYHCFNSDLHVAIWL